MSGWGARVHSCLRTCLLQSRRLHVLVMPDCGGLCGLLLPCLASSCVLLNHLSRSGLIGVDLVRSGTIGGDGALLRAGREESRHRTDPTVRVCCATTKF